LVSVVFTGIDRALCLSSGVDLHGDEIVDAEVVPRSEAKARLGWRVGGGYWPGRLTTGWFTTRRGRGQLQLWNAYGDDELLVVDTTRPKPSRLVLQHPGRHELARRVRAVASGGQPSADATAAPKRTGSSNIG